MKINLLPLLFVLFIVQTTTAQNYKFGKVSKEELSETTHPIDKDAKAAVLYREFETNFEYTEDDGFYLVTHAFERIKIYTKEGFDWGNVVISLYQGSGGNREEVTGLKGYTYYLGANNKIEDDKLRSDGIFDENQSKYRKLKKFTMPNLKEGCVIEYKYTIKSPFISSVDEYRFQETIPVNKTHIRFVSPEYLNYKTHQKGWVPFKIEKDGKDRSLNFSYTRKAGRGEAIDSHERATVNFKEDIYEVNLTHVPALVEEPHMGHLDNYSSSLKFELAFTKFPNSNYESYSQTWEDVSKSIYEASSFGDELKKSNYYESDIDNLLSGASNPDDKMMKIFEFVKNKMTCNTPYGIATDEGVRSAYKDGVGNVGEINLMLTSMFRYAGLNANPILVSTKNHGIAVFPTRDGFNYVVSGVVKGNNVYLFDATNKYGEVNILEKKLLNWQGRMIMKDGASSWVPLIPSIPATDNALITVNLNEDLSMTGTSKSRVTGHYAMEYRETYKDIPADEVRKLLEADKGETDLSQIAFENLKISDQPVKLSFEFESLDVVEDIGGKLYFSPLLFLATSESPFKLEERKYPIDFGYPTKDRYLITINIPEGYSVESLPESTSFGLEQNMGNYKYAISNSENKIQLSVEFAMNEPLMLSEMYGGLKKFYALLIEKENEKVVLVKT